MLQILVYLFELCNKEHLYMHNILIELSIISKSNMPGDCVALAPTLWFIPLGLGED